MLGKHQEAGAGESEQHYTVYTGRIQDSQSRIKPKDIWEFPKTEDPNIVL